MNKFIITIFIVSILSGCGNKIENALTIAGENRVELEKFLNHYRNGNDTEKIKAAEYIVANMPGHTSMTGDYESYYDELDSLFAAYTSSSDAVKHIPEISASYDNKIQYEFDSRIVKADYLINDLEIAFKQWRDGEWAQHLDFEEFCEWLLPYSSGQAHPMDGWREKMKNKAKYYLDEMHECQDFKGSPRAAICVINDTLKTMIEKQTWNHQSYGHCIHRLETFVKLPAATCDEYAGCAVRVLRSKGIPVCIDFTPQWPGRFAGHCWCSFPNLRGKTTMFSPFGSNPDYPHFANTTFAKVYRKTYVANKEYMTLIKKHRGNVPQISPDVFFKDVTSYYVETTDVKIRLLDDIKLTSRDVYIALFDNHEWKVAAWGKATGKKVSFLEMGRNITYIALGYTKTGLKPISNPFHVDFKGKITELVADNSKQQTVKLWRKFPMHQHVMKINETIRGGYIQASNDPQFNKSDKVGILPEWSLTSGHIKISQTEPYRYWRLCGSNHRDCDMAELYFRSNNGNLITPALTTELTDGDPLTNYKAVGDSLIQIIDLGEPVMLKEIAYIRRGDGNAIVPGDSYEIYYWDQGRWNLHKRVVAEDIFINISELPYGSLYYIKGISRGEQARIFTWDNSTDSIVWH